MLRSLYDWVLQWAETPHGTWALGLLALAESSFFPIPPDPLLIALALGAPNKALWFALVCSIASVAGGILGYLIGMGFMETIGNRILRFYGAHEKFDSIKRLYDRYDAWAVAIGGFTPIPYKLFTLTAGMFRIRFKVFVLASAFGRAGRFFLVAGLIYAFGVPIREFIDEYFNVLSIAFMILLVLGFLVVRFTIVRHRKVQLNAE
ncbi:MAG: YqaA family protein [Nitrospinota bacterium]